MISQLHPKAFLVAEVYYANCRLNGATSLLAGPFVSAELAEKCLEIVGPLSIRKQPETRRATFGVVKMKAPGQGMGYFNKNLPAELQGELLLDTGHRETRH